MSKRTRTKASLALAALFCVSARATHAQSSAAKSDVPDFMGSKVTITGGKIDEDFFPEGPASICVERRPTRLCYTAPKEYGRSPTVTLIQIDKKTRGLLFSAESGGTSGFSTHVAILRPGPADSLMNVLGDDISVTNLGSYRVWNDADISVAPIFVTAEFVQGPNESHYSPHRYIISAYLLRSSTLLDDPYYFLQDQYMTVHEYAENQKTDILAAEKPEILTRLRRLNAVTKQKAPSHH